MLTVNVRVFITQVFSLGMNNCEAQNDTSVSKSEAFAFWPVIKGCLCNKSNYALHCLLNLQSSILSGVILFDSDRLMIF
jgi:hypothetical protein